jgi:membrane fusion protein (multidrug efflux system)
LGADENGDRRSDDDRDDAPDEDRKPAADERKDDGKEKGGKEKSEEGTPLYKRPLVVFIGIVVIIAILTAGIFYWLYERSHEWTDDAFIDGYTTRVAPQVPGRVITLFVKDNQAVTAGDPLIDIDPSDYQARLDQAKAQEATARAQVEQAKAQLLLQVANAAQADANVDVTAADLANATADLARYRATDPRAVSRQQTDNAVASERTNRAKLEANRKAADGARAQIEAAKAQIANAEAAVAQADAQVAEARLQLGYTHVVAPAPGIVGTRTVDVGNYVTAGSPILSISQPEIWVTANYKETQLRYMRPGQPVEVDVDTYPDITFHGRVDSIQKATGSYFSVLPAENATGNYVKVVQRVPVKIIIDDDRARNYLLAPGMSVQPVVTVR